MKSGLKKAAVVALMSFSAVSVMPAQSHAIVGAISGNIAMLAAGLVLGFGGGAVGVLGQQSENDTVQGLTGVSGAISALFGLILLDDHNQVSPQFSALSADSASKLGMSYEEVSSYNSQIDEINAIYQSVAQDTQQKANSGASQADLVKFVAQSWNAYEVALAPDTQSALNKVRAGLAAQN